MNYLFLLVWKCLYVTFTLRIIFSESRVLHFCQLLVFHFFTDIFPLFSGVSCLCWEVTLKYYCFSVEVNMFFPSVLIFYCLCCFQLFVMFVGVISFVCILLVLLNPCLFWKIVTYFFFYLNNFSVSFIFWDFNYVYFRTLYLVHIYHLHRNT